VKKSSQYQASRRSSAIACAMTVLLIFFRQSLAASQPVDDFHKNVEPILAHYCYDCHGEGEHKGGITLDAFKSDDSLLNNHDLWWKVLKNVRAGIMPPQKNDRPSDQEQRKLAAWIKYGAFGIDPASPDPGRVTIRRLNRVEYRHTIADLLGVDFDTTGEFPPDDTGYGFDTIGDALSISPLLLEKYMQAAQTVVGQAVPTAAKEPPKVVIGGDSFRSADQSLNGQRLSFDKAATVSASYTPQQAGKYLLHLSLRVQGDFDFDPGKCKVTLKVGDQKQWQQQLGWAEGKKQQIDLLEQWQPGEVPLSFELEPLASADNQHSNIHLQISAAIEGPMAEKFWVPTQNYHRFFPRDHAPAEDPDRRNYARQVLDGFTRKASRRPAEQRTLDRLVEIAAQVYQQKGKTFEQGVAQAMVAVLASPRFLFRVEGSSVQHPGEAFSPVDEYSLASRLSYFIWSSMPDGELLDLAGRGELRENLQSQLTRMLADPRSKALVQNFAGQWLQLRDLDSIPINARIVLGRDSMAKNTGDPSTTGGASRFEKPKFRLDTDLRQDLREEPEHVFSRVLHENRSLIELIDANYTFLNQRLAKLYNIPDVDGDEMRLVQLPGDSPRGGVLTMGAFLVVTSNPTRTSPVKRGQFILDNILGMPSPPPPANVPALEESEKGFKDHEPTFREVLQLHRSQPLCSSCHSRMDPLGLSLENFNALGMWRDMERGQPIDASGKLTTGESFHDIRDLKKIIENHHRSDFYRCITEKMLTYALGRGLDYYDVDAVDRIVDRIEKADGQSSALLAGIVDSVPFQERRNRTASDVQPPSRTQVGAAR
jgi:hypothetical protein